MRKMPVLGCLRLLNLLEQPLKQALLTQVLPF